LHNNIDHFFLKKKTKTLKNNSRQKNTKLRCKNIISGLIIKFTHQSGKICLFFFFHQVAKMFQGTKKGTMKPPQCMANTQKKPNPTSKEAKSSSHRQPKLSLRREENIARKQAHRHVTKIKTSSSRR
jgi:hypothetical protein